MAGKREHKFERRRFFSWYHCRKCGLVTLRNDAINKAARKPCDSDWYYE